MSQGKDVKRFVAIWTNHFSPYAAIDKLTTPTAEGQASGGATSEGEAAQGRKSALGTGDAMYDLYGVGTLVSAAIAALYLFVRRRKLSATR